MRPADLAKLKRTRFLDTEECKQCGVCHIMLGAPLLVLQICQETFVVGSRVIILPCLHSFCELEILKWFVENKTCPTCRFVVESI